MIDIPVCNFFQFLIFNFSDENHDSLALGVEAILTEDRIKKMITQQQNNSNLEKERNGRLSVTG